MTENAFDAAGFVQVNLETGTIEAPDSMAMTLLPVELFKAIPPSADLNAAARIWGAKRGKAFLRRANVSQLTMDVLAQHVQGEIAMIGAGGTVIDVIGDALVFTISGNAIAYASVACVLEGFMAGYISAVAAVAFDVTSAVNSSKCLEIFAGNSWAVDKIKKITAKNMTVAEAAVQLQKEVA